MMYMDAFREALVDPDCAAEIAASFLRLHEQTKSIEEAQHEMLLSVLNVYSLSENQRVSESVHTQKLRDELAAAKDKLYDAGFVDNMVISMEAKSSVTPIMKRVQMWVYYTCWDGKTPFPAWLLDACVPMPEEMVAKWNTRS